MSLTDRNVRIPPALPTLGAANSWFPDPTFGSRILRVTDANFTTGADGVTGYGFETSASGYQHEWNADSAKFWVGRNDGLSFIASFDPVAFSCARVGAGLLALGDIAWSDSNPNLLYSTTNITPYRTLIQLDASTVPPTKTTIVDLDTLVGGLGGNVGALGQANGNLFCIFGGVQNTHMHVLWYPLANPAGLKILHTQTDGRIPSPFGIHSAQIDHSGRFISIIPASGTGGAVYVLWDAVADTLQFSEAQSAGPNGGHEALGSGNRICNDTVTGSYDSRVWAFTPNLLSILTGRVNIPSTKLSPIVGGWGADHSCWHNANPTNQFPPFISGSYRYGDGPGYAASPPSGLGYCLDHTDASPALLTPVRPWDDEIVSHAVDGSDIHYRHCHTRSWLWRNVPTYEGSSGEDIFYYTPRPNISPNGKYAVFTSNWEKSLGVDLNPGVQRQRTDVFLVELTFDPQRDARVKTGRATRGWRSYAR